MDGVASRARGLGLDGARLRREVRAWASGGGLLGFHVGAFLLAALGVMLLVIARDPSDIDVPGPLLAWGVMLAAHAAVVATLVGPRALRAYRRGRRAGAAVGATRVGPATAQSRPAARVEIQARSVPAAGAGVAVGSVVPPTPGVTAAAGSADTPVQSQSRFRPRVATTLAEVVPAGTTGGDGTRRRPALPQVTRVATAMTRVSTALRRAPATEVTSASAAPSSSLSPASPTGIARPVSAASSPVAEGTVGTDRSDEAAPFFGPTMPLLVNANAETDSDILPDATDDDQADAGRVDLPTWARRVVRDAPASTVGTPPAPPAPATLGAAAAGSPTARGGGPTAPPIAPQADSNLAPTTEWRWMEAAAAAWLARRDDPATRSNTGAPPPATAAAPTTGSAPATAPPPAVAAAAWPAPPPAPATTDLAAEPPTDTVTSERPAPLRSPVPAERAADDHDGTIPS